MVCRMFFKLAHVTSLQFVNHWFLVILKRGIFSTFPGSALLCPDYNFGEVLRWDKWFFILFASYGKEASY